ncbi:hypothetical protein ACRZ5S_22790 (plasmid) [Vibrio scophthalmi]|uniref:hypothetical protein n=1 Tax=Vibrio scophthalmi TaxID=45658 RepID=UPI003EBE65D8
MSNSIVRLLNFDCEIERTKYANGQPAIQLYAADTEHNEQKNCFPGEPLAVISICVPDWKLSPNLTCIKNYSECDGLLDDMVSAGLVRDTKRIIPSGHVLLPVVEVLF